MNAESNAMPEPRLIAPAVISPIRLMFWSVRRELWENRSIYIAPLAVAGLALFAFSLSSIAGIWEKRLRLNPAQPQGPYDIAAGLLMLTGLVVSVFYCVDALHGERRDRSILFWKSLPVSDVTAVIAKASIPLVILPLLIFAITVAMQWLMLMLSTVVLLFTGQNVAVFWAQLSFVPMSLLLLYHLLTVHALWYAPFYGWLLLVSAWARRAAFLWAILPLLAIGVVEKIAFNTSYLAAILRHRLDAGTEAVIAPGTLPMDPMTHLTPGHFVSSPGLWVGLAITAAFLAAAVRLRRYQGPI